MDIDICQDGRPRVIAYVRQKYGHVAQIITYGTLKAKAVVRDVGRAMDIPLAQVDSIATKIPDGLNVTLQGALETEPDLKQLYDSDPHVRKMLDNGMSLMNVQDFIQDIIKGCILVLAVFIDVSGKKGRE